jgi:phosphomethylpyrimidine synthase
MSDETAAVVSGAADYPEAYPNSRKVYVGEGSVKAPMREIALESGESALRVYDTSGPQGCDVTQGLPALRDSWIANRWQSLCDITSLRATGVIDTKGRFAFF